MPFLAPMIVAAAGLTGVAATVGTAVVGVGLSVGAGYLARRLQPKPSSTPAQGMRLSVGNDVNEPREILFGTVATAGHLKYHNHYGPNGNDYIQFLYKLADHECASLVKMYVNGKAVTFGVSGGDGNASGLTVSEYPGVMWVSFHSGDWAQAADADLVSHALGEPWSANNRGRGVCYVRVTLKYDEELYKDGLPKFLFVVNGAKLYDWRLDTTAGGSGPHRWGVESTYAWSKNPAVCLYNFRRGIKVNGIHLGGMSCPAWSLPLDAWTTAANACDETVALKAGGSVLRYTMSGVVAVDTDHLEVVREMIASMAGVESDSGGVFRLYAGVAQSPVMTMSDADIMSWDEVVFYPKLSRSGLVNAVFGSFTDPAAKYERNGLPPRVSPADQATDGNTPLTENYGFSYITSATQGQRVMEILRRKSRYQRRISLKLRGRFATLEAGDWITWSSSRYGFSSMQFEVMQATLHRDLTISVELKETSPSIYTWVPASNELDPLNPANVGAGGASFTTIQNVVLQNVTITSDVAASRPGLNVTWTPVTDKTVIDIDLEFRRAGDTVDLDRKILNPASGTYTWVSGVQGGTQYEVRLRPVTRPRRAVTWTAWIPAATASSPQVVAVAAYAETVNPANLPPAILSAQERFELSLIFGTDAVLGSLSSEVAETRKSAEKAHAAVVESLINDMENSARVAIETRERLEADSSLAAQITSVVANFNSANATITQSLQSLASVDQTLASSIETLSTTVDGNTAQVTVIAASIDGLGAKFGVAVSANGDVLGLVQLDASAVAGSTFTVVADNFKVAAPGVAGGDAVPVFSIQNVNGVSKLAFRGDMFADGTITAQKIDVSTLSALSANLGVVTAGLIRNTANTLRFDLPAMRLYRADGKAEIDLNARRIRFSA